LEQLDTEVDKLRVEVDDVESAEKAVNGTGRVPQHDLLIQSLEGAATQLRALLDAQEEAAEAWRASVIPQCIQDNSLQAASKGAFITQSVKSSEQSATTSEEDAFGVEGIAFAGAFAFAAALIGFVRAK